MPPRLVTSSSLLSALCTRSFRRWTGCPYHSYDHPSTPPFSSAESAILCAAYAHVPSHGFTMDALKLGARDAGYLDVSTNLLPRGAFDLVHCHLVTQRLALQASLPFLSHDDDKGNAKGLDVGDRVRRLMWARLQANQPVIHRWQEALAIMAQPSHVPASLAELARLADEIWFLAGDQSVDSSWYTKRATLSAIYSASELYMTQDRSRNFADTQHFLHQRLDEAVRLDGFVAELGRWLAYTGHSAVNVLRSKGVRI